MAELFDPARSAFVIAPSDTVDLPAPTTAIWVGVAGSITVDMVGSGSRVLFANLTVGWHPIQARRVYQAGTSASSMTGVFQ